jgi:outer membrane receptor protein involved in Fe transport
MFALAIGLALAATQPAPPPQDAAPLPAHGGSNAPAVTSPAGVSTVTPPPPATEGGPASTVTPYLATFFAASQPNTARDMVDRLPGFLFDDGDAVRGFAGAAGNVLIDGVRPSSKSDDLDSILRRIPASQVDRIDLIRGGAPGIDMQGKTVMANVIRKTGAANTGLIAAALNQVPGQGRVTPTIRLEGTHRQDGAALEGSLVIGQFFDDGAGVGPEVITAPNGAPIQTLHDDTKGGGGVFTATGAYTTPLFGGTFRTNAQLFGQQYLYDERDQDVSARFIQPTLDHRRQSQEQGEIGLTFDRAFGPKLATETLFIQQLQGEDYLEPFSTIGDTERFREQHTNGESILRSTATYNYAPNLTVVVSAEGAYNWLNSHTSFIENGAAEALPAANVQVTELRGEVSGKATWVINPQFTLEAGLRYEASHITSAGDVVFEKTLTYPKPRLVLTWSPDPADQFRFRIEETVGQLDFNNFIAISSLTTGQIFTGNPNLTPQQALVYEAAYERRFWKSGDFSVTYRHSNLVDVIDRAPVVSPAGDFDDPANIGGGTEDDLITALNVPIDRFGVAGGLIKANLTWRKSRVTDPTTGEQRPLGNLRPREGEIDFNQDLPKWKLTWGATYNLGWRQPYYSFNQVEIDNFRQFGTLFVEYRPKPGLSVRGEIDDIGADFRRTLEVYPDLRSTTSLQDIDIRSLYYAPTLYLRVRQQI